jgi:hypothetical protein
VAAAAEPPGIHQLRLVALGSAALVLLASFLSWETVTVTITGGTVFGITPQTDVAHSNGWQTVTSIIATCFVLAAFIHAGIRVTGATSLSRLVAFPEERFYFGPGLAALCFMLITVLFPENGSYMAPNGVLYSGNLIVAGAAQLGGSASFSPDVGLLLAAAGAIGLTIAGVRISQQRKAVGPVAPVGPVVPLGPAVP